MDLVQNNERILRLSEVKERTGLSRSTIYLWVEAGSFPKPFKLGKRASGWIKSEIDAWIASRIQETRSGEGDPEDVTMDIK